MDKHHQLELEENGFDNLTQYLQYLAHSYNLSYKEVVDIYRVLGADQLFTTLPEILATIEEF